VAPKYINVDQAWTLCMNMTLQHNMLVEVSLLHEVEHWDVSCCTCDEFNTWNDATCVHTDPPLKSISVF
jgi:hypothetical protein